VDRRNPAGQTLLGAFIAGAITRKPVWRGEMPLGPGLALGIWGVFLIEITLGGLLLR